MHFSSFADFFAMGGHAVYVWSSYALMVMIVVWNLISAKRQQQRIKQQLSKRLTMSTNVQMSKPTTGVE